MKQIYLLLILLSVVGHDAAFSQCSLPAPANLEVKMSAESATLTWTNSSAVAYYKVRHRKTGDALWITSAQLTTTSYTITGLTPGISYDIRVVPYCTNNQQGLFAFKVDTTLIPNIILIYLDDAPNGLTNTTGAPSFVQTPNIHKIFKKGMDFPLNSCIISLCAPSRAVMITGHTPAQTGVIDNSTQANFNMSLPTLGERLKEKGVYTAALGKFHDVIGIHGADDWSYRYESVTSQSAATVKFSRNGGPWKKAGTDSIITKVLTDTAIALIQNTAQPLFLLLAVRDPHTPTKVPAPFNHYYDNEVITLGANTAPYTDLYPSFLYDLPNKNYKEEQAMIATLKDEYRALAYVDDRIGAIISALKTTGKLENTMIIFTSDNGLMNSEHGIYGKRHPYKESVNVPLHIWYEEWFTPGSSNLLTSNIDLYATILDAVGIEDHTSAGYSIKEMYDGIATRATAYSSVSYTIEDNYQDLAS
ncbi:MAG TPA: sulfatase-like hydrolase/transferase, partial [Chitinophagales bacterium]|nr:sulfatase-like hydrolase/transferase [Chitinophagales bacterium]